MISVFCNKINWKLLKFNYVLILLNLLFIWYFDMEIEYTSLFLGIFSKIVLSTSNWFLQPSWIGLHSWLHSCYNVMPFFSFFIMTEVCWSLGALCPLLIMKFPCVFRRRDHTYQGWFWIKSLYPPQSLRGYVRPFVRPSVRPHL